MSRLQTIENRLKEINGTAFQELCDSYLIIKNNYYHAVSRTGSQIGKQKTRKGTPDTFFQLPNGNFVYSEITTDTSTKNKLTNDIRACFDPDKTKIPTEKIEEIILCFNWNIEQDKINEIDTLAQSFKKDIKIRYLMLQELAIELHLNHRDLAHYYLDLPLDTGQIVSIDNFIKEYDRASKGIATPLNNRFLHRETELDQLSKALDNYDFIIITGAPGVGKTKLAIESVGKYLEKNISYEAYCISYKSHTLLDDLYQYFDVEKDYILFVDDANRIDEFGQIMGFFKANRKGKLKVIITVRDYAFEEMGRKCQNFSTQRIDVHKLTDEQIIDVIKSEPFEILNHVYHKEIVRIADGNPRLAIMSSLLAKKEQNLLVLYNVSDLFEKYFSTFIQDNNEFESMINIKCLGIISFFHTVPYKDKEITMSILEKFDISYNDFIDAIDKLDKLELIEIQFEHVKVPEQNLATFFFYKSFIKDNLLSFQVLLNNYYVNYRKRFTDTIVNANNTFGSQNVMNKVKPDLVNYWNIIRGEEYKPFEFLNSFWFYLQDETLEFTYHQIEAIPKVEYTIFDTSYNSNQFIYKKDNLIELLGNFFSNNSKYLKDSIELSFEYASRNPAKLPELIHKIKEWLIFDANDESINFIRQKTLFSILAEGVCNDDNLLSISFYELSEKYIAFNFQQFKRGRRNSYFHYLYSVPSNEDNIEEFRKKIWDTINNNFASRPQMAISFLNKYARIPADASREIMAFDIPFILNIIKNHLRNEYFEHCKYVQSQIKWFKKFGFESPEFSELLDKFVNETYTTYLKIDWNRLRDKEIYNYVNYTEYEQKKEAEIRNYFIFTNLQDINMFYETLLTLIKLEKKNYNIALDFVIDENCSRDFDVGIVLLKMLVNKGNVMKYVPNKLFINHLKTHRKVSEILEIIEVKEFDLKEIWELSFYYYLDNSLINRNYVYSLLDLINSISNPHTIEFGKLERFLFVEPKLFYLILKIITKRNMSGSIPLQVPNDFFGKYFEILGEDFKLIKKAYIQQNIIQDYFDYDRKGLLSIMLVDSYFLIDFVKSLLAGDKALDLISHEDDMSFIWTLENIEDTLIEVINMIIYEDYHINNMENYFNIFFKNLKLREHIERSDAFIRQYVLEKNQDCKKMQVIINITKLSKPKLFEEVLLLLISLNPDLENFRKLEWVSNNGIYSGETSIGDLIAAEWKNILHIVNRSTMGIKLIPLKKYINEQVVSYIKSGESERKRDFIRNRY